MASNESIWRRWTKLMSVRRCLPLSAIFTPASLSTSVELSLSSAMTPVPLLAISNASLFREFAYTVSDTEGGFQKYIGPRTMLTKVAVSTASRGLIPEFVEFFDNVTYSQTFYGPLVECQDANSTVASQIDAVAKEEKEKLPSSTQEVSNEYLAFVPTASHTNSTSSYLLSADLANELEDPFPFNQIWLKFMRNNGTSEGTEDATLYHPHYLLCECVNSSIHVNFSWTNGTQSLSDIKTNTLNTVSHPWNFSESNTDKLILAYSAFMLAFSSQIVGSMSFLQDIGTSAESNTTMGDDIEANRTYGDISTHLAQTSLIGSSDLNDYFIKNHDLKSDGPPTELFSTDRLDDMALARNRTLDVLIEELAFNTTISLLTHERFAPHVSTNVTFSESPLIFVYSSRNLLLTYGITLLVSLIAVALGLVAILANGLSHNNTFFSIVGATGGLHDDVDLRLNKREQLGALPLHDELAKRKLVFSSPGQKEGLIHGQEERKGSQSGRLGFAFA